MKNIEGIKKFFNVYYKMNFYKRKIFKEYILKRSQKHKFHMVAISPWPFCTSISAFILVIGFVSWMHQASLGFFTLLFGLFCVLFSMYVWFRDIIREATYCGYHTEQVQQNLRYGFALFIVSEIMFFFGFFWAHLHFVLCPSIFSGNIWPPEGIINFFLSQNFGNSQNFLYNSINEFLYRNYTDIFIPLLNNNNKTIFSFDFDLYFDKGYNYNFLNKRDNTNQVIFNGILNHFLNEKYYFSYLPFEFLTENALAKVGVNSTMLSPYAKFLLSNVFSTNFNTIPPRVLDIYATKDIDYIHEMLFHNSFKKLKDWIESFGVSYPYEFSQMVIFKQIVISLDLLDHLNYALTRPYLSFHDRAYFVRVVTWNFWGYTAIHLGLLGRWCSNWSDIFEIVGKKHMFVIRSIWLEYFDWRGTLRKEYWPKFELKNYLDILQKNTYKTPTIYINLYSSGLLVSPLSIPLFNTILLLSSGVFLTCSHMYLKLEKFFRSISFLIITIAYGLLFFLFQIQEYSHAKFSLNDGIFGSTFYLLTGFHGFHVFVGTVFLCVCLVRFCLQHFTSSYHFGYEAAIWYWHFVDVVWILLFFLVYYWPCIFFFQDSNITFDFFSANSNYEININESIIDLSNYFNIDAEILLKKIRESSEFSGSNKNSSEVLISDKKILVELVLIKNFEQIKKMLEFKYSL